METGQKAICNLPLIPMRAEASEKSEQVSQIIFGETFTIEDIKDSWAFVETHFDNYKGWITLKMASEYTSEMDRYSRVYLKDPLGKLHFYNEKSKYMWIPGGSTLYMRQRDFITDDDLYRFEPLCNIQNPGSEISIIDTALKFLGAPYLWGGRTAMGIDCSGYSQIVCKMNNISIARDASMQALQGNSIDFKDLQPGDLAFFHNKDGRIIHVGIVMENSQIIHASGMVRIDSLDEQGIFNNQTGMYTHHLNGCRRISI